MSVAMGKKEGGGHAPLPLTSDGTAIKTAAAGVAVTKTKPLEATAPGPGNTKLSDLTWAGGTLANPKSIHVEAPSTNSAVVSLGVIGGSGGATIEPGGAADIDSPIDPTLWEIRVGTGDEASLLAMEPVL